MEIQDTSYSKFLYNKTFGSFRLSENFITTFYQKYNENLNNLTTDSIVLRTDIRIIKLFEEIESSLLFSENSSISITYVPTELIKYVNIIGYNGRETIRVNFNLAYREILDDIMDYRILSGISIQKYIRLKKIEQQYLNAIENNIIE